jgi:hypothetical protein
VSVIKNVPLLRKGLEHITVHQDEWDQDEWCGTSRCLAGHIVTLDGWDQEMDFYGSYTNQVTRDGFRMHAYQATAISLGVAPEDDLQLNELWFAGNTLRELWRVASDLTDGEIEVPVELQQ